MRFVVYDIEIEKGVPMLYEPNIEGFEYCAGWHDHANMGISCVGAYDSDEERYRVFGSDNREEFFQLADSADLLVGFNNIPFDNAVIRACWSTYDFQPDSKCYDLLREVWKAAGLGDQFNSQTHAGYGLDAMCEANFARKKSGNGALAPIDWQQGKWCTVIDYCLNDVNLTKKLFDIVNAGMPLVNPKGGVLNLRVTT